MSTSDNSETTPPRTVQEQDGGIGVEAVPGEDRLVPLVLEVFAVLCLAVIPHTVTALSVSYGEMSAYSFTFDEQCLRLIFGSLQVIAPLLTIMALSRCDWEEHGFIPVHRNVDVAWTVLLLIAGYLAVLGTLNLYSVLVENFEEAYDDSFMPSAANATIQVSLLLIVSMIMNAVAEELAMRSYLIPKLYELTDSKTSAVLLSSMLFGIYHMYQGSVGFVNAFTLGVVFGAWFVRFRRIWPLIAAHAVWDIVALMPYLKFG